MDESDDEDEDEEDEEGKGLTRLFVVGSAIFVVVVSVSSSLESDDESDDELEETSRLLRFLCLFLCIGSFVAAGGIFSLWSLESGLGITSQEKSKHVLLVLVR